MRVCALRAATPTTSTETAILRKVPNAHFFDESIKPHLAVEFREFMLRI